MKKHYLYGCLAICLVVFGWAILGLGSSYALAQATEETPGAVMETETPSSTLMAETETPPPPPSPTPSPSATARPDVTLIKLAEPFNDPNQNGSFDPGEVVMYQIKIINNGAELSNLVLQDRFDWVNFRFPDLDKENCNVNSNMIVCNFDSLGPGEIDVSYKLTLKDALDFQGKSNLEIKNEASILMGDSVLAKANTSFQVSAPTPTATLTPTLTPTIPAPSATPAPIPTVAPSGASALGQNWESAIIVILLAFVGIAVFTYMGGFAKIYTLSEIKTDDPVAAKAATAIRNDEKDLVVKRMAMFREGVIIIFIVSTVLLMGIAGALQSDGVISLLSAIVGYVFGRASSRG